ncbi:MAG TPA: MMPL family transporter, partial [Reyranella sp.]|nr:MMPL family transporter [Reyranella sp.]
MGTSLVGRIVAVSIRHSLIVLLATLAATAAALVHLAQNFAMTAETSQLISPTLEWRKRGIEFDKAFPQLQNLTMIVVDGATPELADDAAKRLASALQQRPDLFHNVRQPDGGRFFERNGLLLLPMDDVRSVTDALIKVQPLLAALAADPSLAGAMKMLNVTLLGIDSGDVKLKDIEPQLKALAATFEKAVAGEPAYFSWRTLVTGDAPDLGDTRRLILVQPEMDYGQLQPGQGASDAIRAMARSLKLDPAHGVTVRLTGQVPLADEEFASLADDAGLITAAMAAALIGILWLAVRSTRITIAILCTTLIGLVITAAIGLLAVGRFNLISVAFIPLFVGLGVDFSIQFSVRALAERLVQPNLEAALAATGTAIGKALALSAAAIGVGFFAFLPTSYLGVAELGTVAGLGMIVAFTLTIVLLPTVLVLLRAPQAGMKEVGFTMLAPVDDLVHRHRRGVLVVALLVAIAAAALLPLLRFDYNPLNMKSPRVESMATLHDMQHDRNWSIDAINILVPSLADAVPLARRLADLPEVSRVVSLNSFAPESQQEKLVLIGDAVDVVEPVLDVEPAQPATDAELQQRLGATAVSLRHAAEHSP